MEVSLSFHHLQILLQLIRRQVDTRYNKFFVTKNNVIYTKKFDYNAMDAIVTGFDELLLIYAEALASSGAPADLAEAITWLNKIEKRAYGAPVTTIAASQAVSSMPFVKNDAWSYHSVANVCMNLNDLS
jgi:hypothetical protein